MFFFFKRQPLYPLRTTAFLVTFCSTAIADPVILRDSTIHIDIDHSGEYKVLIDDMDVAPYTTKTSAGIDLVNPFPEKSGAFTVRVVSLPDKAVIFEETYQKAAPGQVFDQIDTVTSGQFDGSFISPSKTRPEPEEGFDKDEAQSAALGLIQVSGTRGAYKSLFELEGVHRSQADERLREAGPAADISRFRLRNELATTSGATFYATVGDLEIASTNSLVNTGVSSRGLVLGFESAGKGVLFEVGRVFGTDIVGAVHGPVAWSEDSYRNSVRTRVEVFDGNKVNIALTGSYLDVKRAAESSFGLADTPVGETNETWGVGTEITAFEERIRAGFSWAKSRYDNPRELNAPNLPDEEGFEVFLPGVTTGSAWRHSLTWNAWSGEIKGKPAAIALDLGAERASPLYRSIHGQATSDRRQHSISTSMNYDIFQGQVGVTKFRNNLHNLISIHTLDEGIYTASLGVDLEQYREVDDDGNRGLLHRFIPSFTDFTVEKETLNTLNGDVIILAPVIAGFDFMNQVTDAYGITTTWQGLNHSTSLELRYSFLDNRQRERANADRKDLYYGIAHEVTRERWSLGGRVGFTRTDDLDTASRSKTSLSEWGLNGSYRTTAGITLSATFDNSLDLLKDYVFAEREEGTSQRFSVTADAGALLQNRFKLEESPSISLTWQKTDSEVKSSYFDSQTSSASFMVNAGLTFK